jgi:hypothetical protein
MNDDTDRTYREICVWYGFDPLAEAEVIAEAEALTGGAA